MDINWVSLDEICQASQLFGKCSEGALKVVIKPSANHVKAML
jgi:hypothetical protein